MAEWKKVFFVVVIMVFFILTWYETHDKNQKMAVIVPFFTCVYWVR